MVWTKLHHKIPVFGRPFLQRNEARFQRDQARLERDEARGELYDAIRELENTRQERDEARRELDKARRQRGGLAVRCEALSAERDLLTRQVADLTRQRNELFWQGDAHQYLEWKGYMVPIELIRKTGAGPTSFQSMANSNLSLLKKWIGIEPSHNVLEIGCGIGRDAISLSEMLMQGSYTGVEIIKRSIDWCTANIASRHSNFRFIHYDVEDELHNSSGTMRTTDIVLPIENGTIDRIFLFSVFTHVFQHDIEHYLREFRRVLKPGGLVYATTFIYTDEILASARKTNLTPYDLRFEHEVSPGCRITDPAHPLSAVAYTREVWDLLVKATSMRYANRLLRGMWSGYYSEADSGQDGVILTAA
jgi:SAM-dependent methyltransferase